MGGRQAVPQDGLGRERGRLDAVAGGDPRAGRRVHARRAQGLGVAPRHVLDWCVLFTVLRKKRPDDGCLEPKDRFIIELSLRMEPLQESGIHLQICIQTCRAYTARQRAASSQ